MRPRQLGDIDLLSVVETEQGEFRPDFLIPAATPDALQPDIGWLHAINAIDPVTGLLVLAAQSYVVRTRHHTILIDTCVGEHKPRQFNESWNMRTGTRYLADLAAAGVQPEAVDYVMCTHLHPDHVGWNTRLVDGRWVPTFPNARYVFSRREYGFWEEKHRRDPVRFADGAIGDSVLPIVEAGRADLVADDFALDDEVRLEPTPGHAPGHVAVHLTSRGSEAVMTGDLIHSPIQCRHPEWSTHGCWNKQMSAETRRGFLERYADTGVLVLTAHFPSPSVGHVVRRGDAFDFRFED